MNTQVSDEQNRRAAQGKRNRFLGLSLFALVALVGIATSIRIANADLSKGGFYYNPDAEKPAATEVTAGALPPGMSAEQAAPPPGLTAPPQAEPVAEEAVP